jgi:hypothetical protein
MINKYNFAAVDRQMLNGKCSRSGLGLLRLPKTHGLQNVVTFRAKALDNDLRFLKNDAAQVDFSREQRKARKLNRYARQAQDRPRLRFSNNQPFNYGASSKKVNVHLVYFNRHSDYALKLAYRQPTYHLRQYENESSNNRCDDRCRDYEPTRRTIRHH